MADRVVVVGAGGFGREALDVVQAVNAAAGSPVWEVLGVVDDNPSAVNLARLASRGIHCFGGVDELPGDVQVVLGIGSPAVRRRIHEELASRGFTFARLVHPTAVLGSEARIGAGAVICAGVSVGTNVTLGEHVHLNPHAVIGHDTTIGDHVSINPNATVSGDCHIGDEVLIGAGAVVLQQLTVGRGAVIGGAACAVADVPSGATVVGVPARERSQP
jgi:sugar O-acyltransferase (sialic acid O-acetyltransferase NeuD family)